MRGRLFFGLCVAAGLVALHAGCTRTDAAPGVLMLAVQTDMHAPKDVDAIGIYVARRNADGHDEIIFGYSERVAPDGSIHFPATLAVVGDRNPGAVVRVRAVAFRQTEARIVNDAITTVPTSRTALLRLPLRWINDNGKAHGTLPSGTSFGAATTGSASLPQTLHPLADQSLFDGFVQIVSGCADDQTPRGGGCAPATVDETSLPDYDEALVFGGGTANGGGTCFDAAKCFAGNHLLALDLGSCSAPAPAGAFDLAIATRDRGDCDGQACYVPLDKDPGPVPTEGWMLTNGRVQLPAAYCARIQSGDALGIVDDTASDCAPKANDAPLCGPASTVGSGTGTNDDGGPIGDGGVDSGSDSAIDAGPVAETIADADSPTEIVQDDNYVYFVSRGGRVDKVPKDGGAVENVVAADGGNVNPAFRLAISDNHLVLGEYGAPTVQYISLPGATASATTAPQGPIVDVAATGGAGYWAEGGDGGAAGFKTQPFDAASLASQLSLSHTVDEIYAYTSLTNGQVRALASLADGTLAYAGYTYAEPYLVASPILGESSTGGPIAEDSSNVYWQVVNPSAKGHILAIPRSKVDLGTTATGIVVVTDDFRVGPGDPPNIPHQIATDYGHPGNGTYLAWTNANDEVWALSSVVAGASPVRIATAELGARGVVLDASYLYWTDVTSGHVRRIPRAGLLP